MTDPKTSLLICLFFFFYISLYFRGSKLLKVERLPAIQRLIDMDPYFVNTEI